MCPPHAKATRGVIASGWLMREHACNTKRHKEETGQKDGRRGREKGQGKSGRAHTCAHVARAYRIDALHRWHLELPGPGVAEQHGRPAPIGDGDSGVGSRETRVGAAE